MDLKKIGVVIPAYNAEKTLRPVLEELINYGFDKQNIIVVDDGSNDGTSRIVRDLEVPVVRHQGNLGKGAALQSGFAFARTKKLRQIFTLDADGQHKVRELRNFLKRKGDYDLIIGMRWFQLASMPFLRKMTNRTTALVVSLLCNTYIPDTQSGFRYIDLNIFDNVRLKTKNFQTESELVIQAARYGYRIGFVPITAVYDNGHSYIRPFIDTLRFITMAVRFLWR